MKKAKLAILLSTVLIVSLTAIHVLYASSVDEAHGPAPNAGDCIPDGSGFDRSIGRTRIVPEGDRRQIQETVYRMEAGFK